MRWVRVQWVHGSLVISDTKLAPDTNCCQQRTVSRQKESHSRAQSDQMNYISRQEERTDDSCQMNNISRQKERVDDSCQMNGISRQKERMDDSCHQTKRMNGCLMFTVKWQPSQRGHHKKLSVGWTRSIKKFSASKRKLDTPSMEQDIPMLRSYLPFHGARHSYAQVVSSLIYPFMEQDIPMLKSYLSLSWSKTFLCSSHICGISMSSS